MKRPLGLRAGATLISLIASGLIAGCGSDGPTAPPEPLPEPGQLRVTLSSSTAVGAVVLTVSGTGITSPAASGGAQLYYDQSGGVLTAVVTGTSLSGEILRFTVPDVAQVAGYEVSLQEVAGTSNQSLASSGVQLSVVR
ncbi:MAG: hypothetical protein WBN79_07560 [Gemmatimonadota bacterium]